MRERDRRREGRERKIESESESKGNKERERVRGYEGRLRVHSKRRRRLNASINWRNPRNSQNSSTTPFSLSFLCDIFINLITTLRDHKRNTWI